MKILYIYRNNSLGFSIGNVFRPVEEEMRKYAEVDSIYMPCSTASPLSIIKNCWYAFKKALSGHYDIIHITGDVHYLAYALCVFRNVVVTVHDVGRLIHMQNYFKRKILYYLCVFPLKFATSVTFISDKTREEVMGIIDLQKKSTQIISNPISKRFSFHMKSINAKRPIVLHIGTGENKNLLNSIKALKDINCELRIIGRLTEHQLDALNNSGIQYSNIFNLTNDEIVQEYINCDIVNFPSYYEGFGMPIIEGQAIGRVVVTSNLSPMREIADNSCVIVDPYNIESMKHGYIDAINNNEYYVLKGIENIKRFSVDKISKKYFDMYMMMKNII